MNIRLEISSLASKHRSGVAQYTRLLSEAFSSSKDVSLQGHYFDFLSRQPKPIINPPPNKLEVNKLVPLRLYAKAQSFGFAPAFDILLPKVDLTIFPNFATWPTLKSRRSATVIHDLTYIYYPEVVESKNLSHLQRVVPHSIKKADFIITVSESVKAELVKEFNLNPEDCIVTPIPPDSSFFEVSTDETIKAIKEKYGIAADKKYIYFIGNLEPRKNLKMLVEAYQLLPQDIKDTYTLVLAGGKGWKTESTEAAINKAIEAGADIKHLGFVDQEDSPTLYQAASLFIMPSFYEGFGMPILEAMASGTPVVASNIPVLKEVGGSYAVYAELTPESFKNAIVKSLDSNAIARETLQRNVYRYSWSDNIDKIMNKVRSLN